MHDVVRPTATALPSQGRRGRPVLFRYRVGDDTPRVGVSVQWSYRGAAGIGFGSLRSTVGGKIYTERFLSGFRNAPARFRFCVQAQDASLNRSTVSCSFYRFLPRTKKKRPPSSSPLKMAKAASCAA